MTDSPTTTRQDICWLTLRGALRRTELAAVHDGGATSSTTHVVDLLEPLGDEVGERLGALGPDDLVVMLSTGTRSTAPGRAEQHVLAVEEEVKRSTSADWVVLRCSPLVQEFVGSLRNALNESIFAAWEEREVPWLDFADVVDVVRAVAGDPERRNRTYELTGGELLSPRQLTDVVAEVCGMPFHYVLLAPEQMAIAMTRAGTSVELAERRTEYMVAVTGPDLLPVNDTVRRALGREPGSAAAVVRSQAVEAYDLARELYG